VRPLRLLAPVILLTLVAPLLSPGDAEAQSLSEIQDRLREAAAERGAIEQRLADAAVELDQLEVTIAELEAEHDRLAAEATEVEGEMGELSEVIAFRVRETFMFGSNLDPIAVFLASEDPDAALSRAQTVQRLVTGDQVQTAELAASRAKLDAITVRLEERSDELEVARQRQQAVTDQLTADLDRAQQLEAQLTQQERDERARLERIRREREEREARERQRREAERRAAQRAAASRPSSSSSPSSSSAPAPSSGGKACPLDQPRHFTDTWGAPRSGGRSHRGTDILGPYGIPVRAITSGTWSIQRPGPSAGLWAILRGDDGNQYWYMHLQSHTVGNGARVSAGQQVATNGDTGNARGTPHIHFELHPGGGSAINPYPLLKSVCG
jgi:peptidoglycan LD-endopeptidase LytH